MKKLVAWLAIFGILGVAVYAVFLEDMLEHKEHVKHDHSTHAHGTEEAMVMNAVQPAAGATSAHEHSSHDHAAHSHEEAEVVQEEDDGHNHGGECVVSGCNSEFCQDYELDSACVWREGFSCFKKSECGRLPSGECGWKETPEFMDCLKKHDMM